MKKINCMSMVVLALFVAPVTAMEGGAVVKHDEAGPSGVVSGSGTVVQTADKTFLDADFCKRLGELVCLPFSPWQQDEKSEEQSCPVVIQERRLDRFPIRDIPPLKTFAAAQIVKMHVDQVQSEFAASHCHCSGCAEEAGKLPAKAQFRNWCERDKTGAGAYLSHMQYCLEEGEKLKTWKGHEDPKPRQMEDSVQNDNVDAINLLLLQCKTPQEYYDLLYGAKDDDKYFFEAARDGQPAAVEFFLQHGLSDNRKLDRALCDAAESSRVGYSTKRELRPKICEGYCECVKKLVERGANIHAQKYEPFKQAMHGDNLLVARFCLAKGLDFATDEGMQVAREALQRVSSAEAVNFLFSEVKKKKITIVDYVMDKQNEYCNPLALAVNQQMDEVFEAIVAGIVEEVNQSALPDVLTQLLTDKRPRPWERERNDFLVKHLKDEKIDALRADPAARTKRYNTELLVVKYGKFFDQTPINKAIVAFMKAEGVEYLPGVLSRLLIHGWQKYDYAHQD